jgi:transposase
MKAERLSRRGAQSRQTKRTRPTQRETMKKQTRRQKRLSTIRRLPDDLWELIQPLLLAEKAAGTVGRPIVPFRTVLDGILYVLCTGCQWKMVLKEYGSGSTCHKRFQEWIALGVFVQARRVLLHRYDELRGMELALFETTFNWALFHAPY